MQHRETIIQSRQTLNAIRDRRAGLLLGLLLLGIVPATPATAQSAQAPVELNLVNRTFRPVEVARLGAGGEAQPYAALVAGQAATLFAFPGDYLNLTQDGRQLGVYVVTQEGRQHHEITAGDPPGAIPIAPACPTCPACPPSRLATLEPLLDRPGPGTGAALLGELARQLEWSAPRSAARLRDLVELNTILDGGARGPDRILETLQEMLAGSGAPTDSRLAGLVELNRTLSARSPDLERNALARLADLIEGDRAGGASTLRGLDGLIAVLGSRVNDGGQQALGKLADLLEMKNRQEGESLRRLLGLNAILRQPANDSDQQSLAELGRIFASSNPAAAARIAGLVALGATLKTPGPDAEVQALSQLANLFEASAPQIASRVRVHAGLSHVARSGDPNAVPAAVEGISSLFGAIDPKAAAELRSLSTFSLDLNDSSRGLMQQALTKAVKVLRKKDPEAAGAFIQLADLEGIKAKGGGGGGGFWRQMALRGAASLIGGEIPEVASALEQAAKADAEAGGLGAGQLFAQIALSGANNFIEGNPDKVAGAVGSSGAKVLGELMQGFNGQGQTTTGSASSPSTRTSTAAPTVRLERFLHHWKGKKNGQRQGAWEAVVINGSNRTVEVQVGLEATLKNRTRTTFGAISLRLDPGQARNLSGTMELPKAEAEAALLAAKVLAARFTP